MIEWLALLLPLAAASGYWIGRRAPVTGQLPCADYGKRYFKGINYVINDQPDKAIDLFVRLLEVDSETLETHFALGHLFRRRGETERAIRIHQNLIARPQLREDERAQAILELGLDYLHAGLLDRAEQLFRQLLQDGQCTEPALTHLLKIYEREKDWEHCLEAGLQLQGLVKTDLSAPLSHYCCELAETALAREDLSQAEHWLNRAAQFDPPSARVSILRGHWCMRRGEFTQAIESYQKITRKEVIYLHLVINHLEDCYRALHRENELSGYYQELYRQVPDTQVLLVWCRQLLAQGSLPLARELLEQHLDRHVSMGALLEWTRLHDSSMETLEAPSAVMNRLAAWLKTIHGQQAAYCCERCGFAASQLHWQCPGCQSWSRVRPVHGY